VFEVNRPTTTTSTATARLSRRDVRCSPFHSIDLANAVSSARIEFGRKLRGAAGSYGRGIGVDDQNQYADRPGGPARWRSVGPPVLLSSCPSQSVAPILPAVIRPVSRTDRVTSGRYVGQLSDQTGLGLPCLVRFRSYPLGDESSDIANCKASVMTSLYGACGPPAHTVRVSSETPARPQTTILVAPANSL